VLQSIVDVWQGVTWEITLWDSILPMRIPEYLPQAFDMMWYQADLVMWNAAKQLDKPGEPGRVAKEFGLIDPHSISRPTFTEYIFRSLEPSASPIEAATTPAPAPSPYFEAIPTATPSESAAKSGHAYASEINQTQPKPKQKTRGTAVLDGDSHEAEVLADEDDREGLESFPAALPTHFKLGKRLMKVFHRVLEDDKKIPGDNALKKGQLRWGEFERAMRRIGFDVVQTAGSSVRFDPPAQTARPITFHRPHPDSLMSPHMIKWVGARLKRCYGWTTAMFAQGTEAE